MVALSASKGTGDYSRDGSPPARRHRLGSRCGLTVEREEHRERRDRRLVDHGREQLVRAPEVRLDGAQSERSSGLCGTLALQFVPLLGNPA